MLGWTIALLMVTAILVAGVKFRSELSHKGQLAAAEKNAFLAKVRACIHKTGARRLSWTQCELIVRSHE